MKAQSHDALHFATLAELTHGDHLLAHLTIPGPPSNKKNSQRLGTRKLKDGRVVPAIFPSRAYASWERGFLRVVKSRPDIPRPLAPSGRLLKVEALFYLAPRQQPDLPGLLEAVCDSLEKSGLLESDYWVNDFGRSARIWPPKGGSKKAKAAREAWAPRTEIFVYDGKVTR